MSDRLEQVYTLIQTYPKRALTLAGLALVIVALPLTLAVSQQQQNIVQHASENSCSGANEVYCGGSCSPTSCPNGATCDGGVLRCIVPATPEPTPIASPLAGDDASTDQASDTSNNNVGDLGPDSNPGLIVGTADGLYITSGPNAGYYNSAYYTPDALLSLANKPAKSTTRTSLLPGSNTTGGTAGNSILNLMVGLQGFSKSNSTSTSQPKTNLKTFLVQILDKKGAVIANQKTTLTLDKTSNTFKGVIPMTPDVEKDAYNVSVKSDGYFEDSSTSTTPLDSADQQTLVIPQLQAGDIVGDNTPNILDYNVFVSCSIYSQDGGAACVDKNGASLKPSADLNGDGIVDQDDYTILLKSWKLLNP